MDVGRGDDALDGPRTEDVTLDASLRLLPWRRNCSVWLLGDDGCWSVENRLRLSISTRSSLRNLIWNWSAISRSSSSRVILRSCWAYASASSFSCGGVSSLSSLITGAGCGSTSVSSGKGVETGSSAAADAVIISTCCTVTSPDARCDGICSAFYMHARQVQKTVRSSSGLVLWLLFGCQQHERTLHLKQQMLTPKCGKSATIRLSMSVRDKMCFRNTATI